jgi:proteasome lid subunit RPN8/RPN11
VLPEHLRQRIAAWSVARLPREACGFLLGARAAHGAEVHDVVECANRAPSSARFRIDPVDHLAAEEAAAARGLAIVGVWHAHPGRPAQPSRADRATAVPGWSYAIQSVDQDRPAELRSWRLEGTRFVEERLGY